MAKLSYSQAIRETIAQEMRRDERVFVMGEDVEKLGGVYGCTRDLYKEFGTDRVRNTPISESAIIGAALGAASGGMRPIAELMYWDFAFVAADQIFNQVAKTRYVFGGNANWKGIGDAFKGFFVAENKNVGDSIAHTLGNVAAVYLLGNTTVANKAGDVKLKAGSPASKTLSYLDKDGNWNEILKVVG